MLTRLRTDFTLVFKLLQTNELHLPTPEGHNRIVNCCWSSSGQCVKKVFFARLWKVDGSICASLRSDDSENDSSVVPHIQIYKDCCRVIIRSAKA